MAEEETSTTYWAAVRDLDEVIASGHRGSRQDVLDELDNDLAE